MVGDRPVDPGLRDPHAPVEPLGDLVDPVAQHRELVLQAGGVRHEIRALLAEHRGLLAPEPRSLIASTIARISATSAPPAAASATMPWVVLRSSTATA